MKKIMLAGPSGVGKTTLAMAISESMAIPFVSGSISDVDPKTKDVPHKQMIADATLEKEIGYVRNRFNEYMRYETFVSDRSYLDNIAYGIHKLSHKYPYCDIKALVDLCSDKIFGDTCDVIILVGYDYNIMRGMWTIEDNNKRVTNPLFQALMSKAFNLAIECSMITGESNVIDDSGFATVFNIHPNKDNRADFSKEKKLIRLCPGALQFGVPPTARDWYGPLLNYLHNYE